MSTPVVKLEKITSASKEAYFSWEITLPSGIDFKKGMLCLTDIDQDGDAGSAIYKYQLHSTESPAGAHIFEDLHVGQYYAQLTIIGSDNSIHASDLLTETVYDLGAAKIASVSARNAGFIITLDPYDGELQEAQGLESKQEILTVSFVLFGRKTDAAGLLATGSQTSEHINIVKDYNEEGNVYDLTGTDLIKNSWKYEIACFYTDNKLISGDISNTVVETPTNKPNEIRDVEAIYDYENKQLIIKYTNPDDISEWTPKNVRATLTYGSTVQTYVFPISASSNSGTDFQGQQLVFNEFSSPALTADTEFTLTLAMEDTKYGYSDSESEAITCIVPANFCSDINAIHNVVYIVGDNGFSVTYDKDDLDKYDVTVKMIITEYGSITEAHSSDNYVSGTPVTTVVNGESYKVNLQVFYTPKFDPSIEFGPCTADIEEFDKTFIPHGQADAPGSFSVVYGDGTATLSWVEPDFKGYELDHYELSKDNGAEGTWFTNESGIYRTISCDNEYVSGTTYQFKVRAVTTSPDASVYDGKERTNGEPSSLAVSPLKKPQAPSIVSQTPGDTICTITFSDGDRFNGIKQHYNYTISNAPGGQIPEDNTSYTFEELTNNDISTISISLVTKSGDNEQESEPAVFTTTPYKMSDVPTLSAKPYTDYVELTWSNNNPTTILNYPVQYEVEYKPIADSDWIKSNTNATSPLTISGLTPNSEYNFKIRSKVYNSETGKTIKSDDSTIITSRPFKYRNAPTMNIIAGNGTITVEITPPVFPNENLYAANMYYATVDPDPDTNGSTSVIQTLSSNTSTLIFNVGNSGLVNLDKYKVVAWYDMKIIGESYVTTTDLYESFSVSNSATPFDKTIVPDLHSDPDDGKITLSWDDLNMYGLDITHYEVSSKLHSDPGTDWGAWERLSVAECNQSIGTSQDTRNYYIDRPATNGTKMNYKIRAVIYNADKEYTSDDSNVAIGTPYTDADAPTLVSYVSSDQQITLTWAEPSNLGGLPLYRYEVSKDSGSWTHIESTVRTKSFSGLTNGLTYTFAVRAVTDNRDNVDQDSNLDIVNDIISENILYQYAIPYAVPTISIDAVVSGDKKLDLSWTENLGGHDFDHYKIHYNDSSIDNITSHDQYYSITSLNNGTAYACKVEVYVKDLNDNAAHPVFSETSSNVTNTPYVPAVAPKNVGSVPSDESVELSWDSLTISELGGLPLRRYEVQKEGDSAWISANKNLSYNFTGLDNGEEYTFYVRAVTYNENHASDPAKLTDEVVGAESSKNDIPFLPLAAPLITNCEPKDRSAVLTWSAPNIVGLTLDYYEVSGGALTSPVNVYSYTQYTFTGLSNNTEYSFYVKAVATHTYAGSKTGPDSEEVTKIPFVKPDKVTNLVCTAINGTLTVYFDDPDTSSVNNGLEQDYKIKLVRDDESLNNIDYDSIINGGTIPIPTDTTETIKVYVYSRIRNPNIADNNNNSVYSDYNNINVVNSNLVSDIQNLTATPGDQQITLKWENVNADSGSTYAIVRIKEDGSFERLPNVYTTTATITNLSDGSRLVNGTLYRFNVYASQDDMLQITATPIGKPIINSVSNSGSNFTVNVNFNGDTQVYITILGITSDTVEVMGPGRYTDTVNTIIGASSSYLKYVVIVSNSIGSEKLQSA